MDRGTWENFIALIPYYLPVQGDTIEYIDWLVNRDML